MDVRDVSGDFSKHKYLIRFLRIFWPYKKVFCLYNCISKGVAGDTCCLDFQTPLHESTRNSSLEGDTCMCIGPPWGFAPGMLYKSILIGACQEKDIATYNWVGASCQLHLQSAG